jgi:hypothetical protein
MFDLCYNCIALANQLLEGSPVRLIRFGVIVTLTAVLSLISFGQQQDSDANDIEKAKAALEAAVKARGGSAYLSVRSEIGTGQFNQFDKGLSTVPVSFTDYIQYPDKERTEFGHKKGKFVQANVAASGWTFDGASKALKDQGEEQTKEFVESMKYSMDGILRGSWREPKVKLTYYPRREAWRLKFGEAVKMEFPDNTVITLFLDLETHLPILLQREHLVKDQPQKEETRFAQWVDRQGIMAPNILDTYIEGTQTNRVNYDSRTYNQPISANMFAKPTSVKDIK